MIINQLINMIFKNQVFNHVLNNQLRTKVLQMVKIIHFKAFSTKLER